MTSADRGIVAATIIVSMILGLAFMIGLGRPWRADAELRSQAWLQAALVATPVALDLVLLFVVLRIVPPLWLIVAVLAGQDAVYGWRLFVLFRAHRERIRS